MARYTVDVELDDELSSDFDILFNFDMYDEQYNFMQEVLRKAITEEVNSRKHEIKRDNAYII